MTMLQGDAYNLGIRVLNNAGSVVTPQDMEDMEITIGNLRKTYSAAQLTFHEGVWLFPLSQKETFAQKHAAPKAQVRVKWKNGVVEGAALSGVRIQESISREVL